MITRLATFIALVSVCLLGCNQPDEIVSDDNKQVGAATKLDPILSKDTSYRAIFDSEYPQHTITNRMESNFQQFAGRLETTELFHFESAGLHVYQPENMSRAQGFTGFTGDRECSLRIVMTPRSFEQALKTLTKSLQNKSREFIFRKRLSVDSQDGIFFVTRDRSGSTDVIKYILAFGREEISWVITGKMLPEQEPEYGEDLIASLFNVRLSEQPRLPPGSDVDFTIQSGQMNIVDGFLDRVMFTADGVFQPGRPGVPVFEARRRIRHIDENQQLKVARANFRPKPAYKVTKLSSRSEIRIDDLGGFEFVGLGEHSASSVPVLLYSVTLFDEQGSYILRGWGGTLKKDRLLKTFRSMATSFRRKPKDNTDE